MSIGLTACGSSSKNTAATTGSAGKLNGTPISVEVITGLTGVDPQTEDLQGAQAAASAINASGGIQGHPLQVISCDANSNTDPSSATACGRGLVGNAGVLAEIGDLEAFQQQVNAILLAAGVPNIAPQPDSASVLSSSNSFPLQGAEAAAGAVALADAGAKQINVAYANVAAAAAAVTFNQIALQQSRGIKLVGGIPIDLTATDMSPYASKAASKGDGVAMAVGSYQLIPFVKVAKQDNYPFKISTAAATITPSVLSSMGAAANGLVVDSGLPFVTGSESGIARYRQEMDQYQPGKLQDEVSLNAWLGTWTFAKVARTISGPITRASLMTAMNSQTDLDVFGLLPQGFSTTKAFNFPGLGRLFNQQIVEGTVQDGKLVETSKGYVPIFAKA